MALAPNPYQYNIFSNTRPSSTTSTTGMSTGTAGMTGLKGTSTPTPTGYNQFGAQIPGSTQQMGTYVSGGKIYNQDDTYGPTVNYQPGVPEGQQVSRNVSYTTGGATNMGPIENQTPKTPAPTTPYTNAVEALKSVQSSGAATGTAGTGTSPVPSGGGADVAQGGGPDISGAAGALGAALTLGASSGTNNGVDSSLPEQPYGGNVLRNGLGTRSYPQDSWVLAGLQRAY